MQINGCLFVLQNDSRAGREKDGSWTGGLRTAYTAKFPTRRQNSILTLHHFEKTPWSNKLQGGKMQFALRLQRFELGVGCLQLFRELRHPIIAVEICSGGVCSPHGCHVAGWEGKRGHARGVRRNERMPLRRHKNKIYFSAGVCDLLPSRTSMD